MIKKILHTEWSGGFGGQEIRTLSEMQGLKARGYWVGLAAAPHTPIYQKAEKLGLPVFALPFRGNLDLKTLFGLIKIIRAEKIDLVNTHSGKDTYVGGLAAKLCRIKFIRTRHLSYRLKKSSLIINRLADHVITTGEKTARQMIELGVVKKNKISVIPTYPDPMIFNPEKLDRLEAKKFLMEKFKIQPDEIIIGTVAFLRKMKRVDLFVLLAERILNWAEENKYKYKYKYKFKFLIIGDGPCFNELAEMVNSKKLEEKIIFAGQVEHPEFYLAGLDIGLLTSDSGEASPQALSQYLLMGLPSLVSDICALPNLKLSESYQCVFLDHAVEKSVDYFFKKLVPMILNLEKIKREAMTLRPVILEKYSSKIMLDQIEKVLSEI